MERGVLKIKRAPIVDIMHLILRANAAMQVLEKRGFLNMRAIEQSICSCGGEIKIVTPTDEEDDRYNCMRGC